jgi:hypothetical protein
MTSTQQGRQDLAMVLSIVRSTEVFGSRPNSCHKWVNEAGSQIALLDRRYWDNDDYKIEQMIWNVTPWLENIDHGTLQVTFKKSGKVAHFDNGYWGDSTLILNLPELIGGISFDEEVTDPQKSVKHGPYPLDKLSDHSYF